MAGSGIVITVHIDGARETLDAFRRLPKEADTALRDASQRIAEALAPRVKSAAQAEGRQAALMAGTVKALRGQLPMIQAGGAGRVGRNRKPAYKLLFGSEFGATKLKQFKPHMGAHSYWFFRSVEDNEAEVSRQWNRAADEIVESFTRDGG